MDSNTEDRLIEAIERNDKDTISKLVNEGLDVNAEYSFFANENRLVHFTPLVHAAFYGHLDTIEFLLSKGADINKAVMIEIDSSKDSNYPFTKTNALSFAALQNNYALTKFLWHC